MPSTLENLKAMLAAGDVDAALRALTTRVAPPLRVPAEEVQYLSARWRGLQRLAMQHQLSAHTSWLTLERLQQELSSLVEHLQPTDLQHFTPKSALPTEPLQLTFISTKQRIRYRFEISPHQRIGDLKKILIDRFNLDTRAPLDADNPEPYLVVNRTALMNDHLSLLEAGIKNQDEIQINVQYHKKMVWSQSVPTRLVILFTGFSFAKPKVIINNTLKASLLSLTDRELEVEFYTYDFTSSIHDLIFHFRVLDDATCLEFQEVVNARGKVIDLQRLQRALPASTKK